MRIYAADDSPVMLGRLRETLLGIKGASVVATFNDGQALLDAVKQDPPDLVCTDVQMPFMTGLEVAKAIAELGLKTRVILCTSVGQHSALDGFRTLIKPFTRTQMHQAVWDLFKTLDFTGEADAEHH